MTPRGYDRPVKLLLFVGALVLFALLILVVAGMNLDSPGDAILGALEVVILPDWNFLISLIPAALVLGVLGPILTLLVLGWVVHLARRRRGRARFEDPQPRPVELDQAGEPVIPPNEPYCPRDWLVYPAGTTRCPDHREDLLVRCPIDSTTRPASQQLCRACGTKYVLGARAIAIQRPPGPPEGGAAAA